MTRQSTDIGLTATVDTGMKIALVGAESNVGEAE